MVLPRPVTWLINIGAIPTTENCFKAARDIDCNCFLVRDVTAATAGMMLFQIVVVASGVFLAWFWLLKRYKASQVAAFAFLSPVFGVLMGWLWLGETVTTALLVQLGLVVAGIVLINRR